MFAAVWTNEGQYGIINSDVFHNFDVHTGKSLNGFFKLSAEVYDFRMVRKIDTSKRIGAAEGKFVVPDDFDVCNDKIAEIFGAG